MNNNWLCNLKVLANEKRGGVRAVSFDRSPFKLFSLKFSNKSVQAQYCERPKTTQWTPFLPFEINNCFQLYCTSSPKFEMTIKIGSSLSIIIFSKNAITPAESINSDVWIGHMAFKFPGFFHKPPTLYRYWQKIIDFKWQKQGSLSNFRPLTGWGLHWFAWKSQRELLKGRPIKCYHFQPTSFRIGQYL